MASAAGPSSSTMDNKEEHTTTADSADSDVYLADGSSSGSLKEEEKVEEDAIVDRLAKTQPESNNAQLKTPEDENSGNNETSDVYEERKLSAHQNNEEATDVNVQHVHKDMQQNDNEEATLPQEGTVAEIPEDNSNSAHEDAAVFSDNGGDERSVVEPGFMFIAGPDYTGTGIHTGYVSGSDDGNINEGAVILQGFLPEDDPLRRRRSRAESTREQRIRERVQRLIDNAITLDDSAVKPIPFEEDGDEENNGLEGAQSNSSDGVAKSDNRRWFDYRRWFVPLMWLLAAAGITLAIALPLSMRGKSENAAQDNTASFNYADCLPGEVDVRFELAKSILSSITSPDLLEDESTPQGKAIRWIVCDDSISVQLFENQDTVSGNLPKQKHGFRLGGDAGEVQVTRRYILAAFFYSTSQVNPWIDSLNFLSPDLHECNWHKNYTRSNFPYGDFDPVGMFCTMDRGDLDSEEADILLLNDENHLLYNSVLNFRIDNDLNGPLPPEIGYLIDCNSMQLENNIRLTGPLPQTIGNMIHLVSFSLILNGPKFGGELPSSLFQLKNLKYITIMSNLGKDWSLPTDVQVGDDTQLEQIVLVRNNFSGAIPSWIAKLKKLQKLDLSINNFQGAIPEAIGDLSAIKYFNLMGNNLVETIPSSLGKLPAIDVLILGNNALQGELPASIGNLRTLQLLDVGSNMLT
eukprot:CAMPEP_0113435814 /NCGR_PEP_ID=MMETSP0013_2-20120614/36484_1 /TAXON_ID=2843 ORGANISM="Skeletonema costatum, Strain 1716" /NCGR_SAMPLE_ID=MMETSP0013_2 /ASSEMBLY_ACC=CAM_ASM_000158 /LENGTH=690 /DNA_ID=CAMNT_0000326229 /DNA_START=55 /DNA_END=2123 /DNA_ORIENTATION=+ /assembly_acc=CAM_ASM_000158